MVVTLHNYRLLCASGSLFRDGATCTDCVGHLPAPAIRHGCYRGSKLATVPVAVAGHVHRHAWRTMVSAYICLSRSQRDLLAPFGLPDDRVFVKSNLVPFVDPPPPRSTAGDTVVFAGRLDEAKGVPLLMAAWDRYSSEAGARPLRLVIAGAGPLGDAVSAWARDRSDVVVAGLLSPEECRALMATARGRRRSGGVVGTIRSGGGRSHGGRRSAHRPGQRRVPRVAR